MVKRRGDLEQNVFPTAVGQHIVGMNEISPIVPNELYSFSLSFQPPTSAVDRQDGPDVAGLLPQVEQPPQQPPRCLRPPTPGMI